MVKKNIIYYRIPILLCLLTVSFHIFANGLDEPTDSDDQRLSVTVGGYTYDRLKPIIDGTVEIEGCQVEYLPMGISDINTNLFSGPQTLDITEIGLHPFMLAYANDDFRDYTLLAIFPLRAFRHKSIFIRTGGEIETPEDLRGKSIATPGYASTSLTWIRGILQDEYGVSPEEVTWVLSDRDSSAGIVGQASAQEQTLPDGISIKTGSPGMDESELLLSGEVDALFHAVEPEAFSSGDPRVARLFPDSRATEREYYDRTGVFPIMHAVAIKTSLLEENPWLAKAVFDAYSEAKSLTYRRMKQGWANDMMPWYNQELESTIDLMGENFYSYGLKDNRKTLEALFRYSYEQGLANRELTVEELFHPLGWELEEEL